MIHIRTDDEYEQAMKTVETNPSYPIPTRPLQQPAIDKEMIEVIIDADLITKAIPIETAQQSSQTIINKQSMELPIVKPRILAQQPPKQAIPPSNKKNSTTKKSTKTDTHTCCLNCHKSDQKC